MDQWREGCGLPPPRTIDPVVKEEGRGRRRARRGAWVGVSRHFVLTLCIGGILAQEWKTSPHKSVQTGQRNAKFTYFYTDCNKQFSLWAKAEPLMPVDAWSITG